MLTTAGMAFFAASAYVATREPTSGVAVSCVTITLPARPFVRAIRSGRNVATTNSAARHSVQAWAKKSQNLRSIYAKYSGTGRQEPIAVHPRKRGHRVQASDYISFFSKK